MPQKLIVHRFAEMGNLLEHRDCMTKEGRPLIVRAQVAHTARALKMCVKVDQIQSAGHGNLEGEAGRAIRSQPVRPSLYLI